MSSGAEIERSVSTVKRSKAVISTDALKEGSREVRFLYNNHRKASIAAVRSIGLGSFGRTFQPFNNSKAFGSVWGIRCHRFCDSNRVTEVIGGRLQ